MSILFAILGLIVGSFLNAVIYRLHVQKSIADGRSICPHCKHVLEWFDLIPVFSFIFLGGKCRYCSKKISWQYPIVETITAISFLLLSWNFQTPWIIPTFWFQLIFICFFIVIAVYDLKYYLILDKVILPGVIIAIIYAIYTNHIQNGIIGVLIISGFFAFQYFASRGRWIGFGDVKFGVFLGVVFGVGQSLILLMLSYFSGALVGLALLAAGTKRMNSKLPFGTFLAFCGIIMTLYGPAILAWYLKITGI